MEAEDKDKGKEGHHPELIARDLRKKIWSSLVESKSKTNRISVLCPGIAKRRATDRKHGTEERKIKMRPNKSGTKSEN